MKPFFLNEMFFSKRPTPSGSFFFLTIDQGTCYPGLKLFKKAKFFGIQKSGLIDSSNCWTVQNLTVKELPETAAAGTWLS